MHQKQLLANIQVTLTFYGAFWLSSLSQAQNVLSRSTDVADLALPQERSQRYTLLSHFFHNNTHSPYIRQIVVRPLNGGQSN